MKEPKIRLKGFTGEWNETTIGEIAAFSKGRGYSKSDLKTQGNPIILYGRLYTNYASTIKEVDTFATLQKGSVLSKGNEVIIPASGETPEDIAIASYVQQQGVILGGDLNVLTFDSTKINPAFAAIGISNSKTHTELSGYAQGKSVVHLHNGNIAKGHLTYPSVEEQESIISYINSLDSLIQSTTKKIESLKQVKAASLQSMFPQEGETTPRVRFKGFVGDWDVVTIDSICKKSVSKHSENSLGENVGQYPIYGASGYIQNIETYDFDVPYVGVIKDGSGVGRSQLYPAYSSILGTMQYILPKGDMDVTFLAYLFETINFSSYVNGSSIPHIYFKDYSIKNVKVPSINEQRVIGEYFQNLDSQIALLSQQLEKLQQIKSACLDNMFV